MSIGGAAGESGGGNTSGASGPSGLGAGLGASSAGGTSGAGGGGGASGRRDDASGGHRPPPQWKGRGTPLLVAVVVVVGAVGVFLPGPILRLFETKSFATCTRDILVKSQSADEKKAFQVGLHLQDLLTADGGSAPVVMTDENHSQTEYQVLSDDNKRLLIQGCAGQYGIQLSRPVLRATVTALTNTQRPLRGAKIALAGDERQACTTEGNGTCDLTIERPTTETYKLAAHAKGYSDAEQTVAGSAFLGGVKFTLTRASISFVITLLRRHKELEGARVSVYPESGTEVWGSTCEATGGDTECQTETTNAKGEATFFRLAPFAGASADVSFEGERRSFSLGGGANIRARYLLNWEGGAVGSPTPTSPSAPLADGGMTRLHAAPTAGGQATCMGTTCTLNRAFGHFDAQVHGACLKIKGQDYKCTILSDPDPEAVTVSCSSQQAHDGAWPWSMTCSK
jgi:hypothetical protein